MKKKSLKEHQENLLKLRSQILNRCHSKSLDEVEDPSSSASGDEGDNAAHIIQQQFSLSMKSRDLNKLRLIDLALERINEGSYGICEDCDEEIPHRRLLNQPWTNLCIFHAEEKERGPGRHFQTL